MDSTSENFWPRQPKNPIGLLLLLIIAMLVLGFLPQFFALHDNLIQLPLGVAGAASLSRNQHLRDTSNDYGSGKTFWARPKHMIVHAFD